MLLPATAPPAQGALDEGAVGDKALSEAAVNKEDEMKLMQRRLAKSDELIKQLKHIIKAQHGKIEELRQKLELEVPSGAHVPSFAVQNLLGAEMEKEHHRTKENNEQLTRSAGRLKYENEKLKKECESLRKVNRRFRSMLQQTDGNRQGNEPPKSAETDRPRADTGLSSDTEDQNEDVDLAEDNAIPKGARHSLTGGGARRGSRQSIAEGRQSIVGGGRNAGGGVGMKLSRMVQLIPSLWSEGEKEFRGVGARGVLLALIDSTTKLLSESSQKDPDRRTLVTVYMSDLWLRGLATDPESKEAPPLFYLDGKVTMEAVQHDGKAEPPHFASLNALPMRNARSMAVIIQTVHSKKTLAVLQATQKEDSKKEEEAQGGRGQRRTLIGAQGSPLAPLNSVKRASTREMPADMQLEQPTQSQLPEEPTGFNDGQQTCLTILASVTGGVLEQQEILGRAIGSRTQMQDCLNIALSFGKAKSLADFEQRVKTELTRFFNVMFVRILFYDSQSRELLVSASQATRGTVGGRKHQKKKKVCQSFDISTGVVGKCAKMALSGYTDKPQRFQKLGSNPAIDPERDGTAELSHILSADSGMMAGAMVFDAEDSSKKNQLVGVVQIIQRERSKRHAMPSKAEEGGPQGDFTEEEEELLGLLLQGAAAAASRTIETQSRSTRIAEGQSPSLAQMLSG